YSATGGVQVAGTNSRLTLGGSVRIYNNKVTNASNALARNIYLSNAANAISVDSKLTGGQIFTIWRSGRGIFTSGYGLYNTADPATVFKSEDSPDYEVVASGAGDTLEGMMWCYDNALNWSYACAQSAANGGAQQTVTLYSNWTAETNSSYTTAFGTDSYYTNGGLYVPSNVNIVLDLKGYTVNRALSSSTKRDYGWIARVSGKLTIIDSSASKSGTLTGAWNTYSDYRGGAITVYNGGTLTLRGGRIINNRGTYGGISVNTTGKLELGGTAQVYNNYTIAGANTNIYLHSPNTQSINVISQFTGEKLTGGQVFGVTRLGNGTFTNGFEKYNPDTDAEKYFKSENSNYFVFTDSATGANEAGLMSYVASTNWEYAVTTSLANSARPETAKLYSTWNAVANSSSGFGTVTNCYTSGALYVPAGASVILDLNNYNVNRNCSSGIGNGYVIYVAGTLTIRDTSTAKGGRITGGYNSSSTSTGGIFIASGGTVNFESGNIVNNRYTGSNGAAVLQMRNNSTFNMTGGSITGNSVTNAATSAGVLYNYNYQTNVTVRITGGSISNNSTANTAYASGFHLVGNINFELGGSARIFNNKYGALTRNVYHTTNDTRYKIVADIEPTFYVGVTKTTNNYLNTEGLIFTEGWGEHYTAASAGTAATRAAATGGTFFADEADIYKVIENGTGTLQEQALWTISNAKNWQEAVSVSASQQGAQQVVTLYSDWTAISNSSYTTAFQQTSAAGTTYGYIYQGAARVSSAANILLNMNGYTMNRNLTAARNYGCAIRVDGKLEIINEVDPETGKVGGKGTIRGGYSNTNGGGGGIWVYSGSLSLHDVDIVNNYAPYGGVYVAGNYPLTLGGSVQISNNKVTNASNAQVHNLYLGNPTTVITIDKALTGSQISLYRSGRGVFTSGYSQYHDVATDPVTKHFISEFDTYEVIASADGKEGEMFCHDNTLNWSYVVDLSISTQKQQTFVMDRNWTATSGGSYGTYFGNSGSGWSYGGLYVPANADVVLDLNGFTLNRALTSSTGVNYGMAIRVNGKLKIIDSKTDASGNKTNAGKIIGAYNKLTGAYRGAAIVVYANGSLTIEGGQITGNYGIAAVSVNTGGKLALGENAQIYGNRTISNTVAPDVYLWNTSDAIDVSSKFTGSSYANGQQFSIYRPGFGALTSGYGATGNTADPETYFVSAHNDYVVSKSGEGDTLEADIYSTDPNINWEYAIRMSRANGGQPWTCKLYRNWTATTTSSSSYYSNFSPTGSYHGTYYYYGALYVPSDASVILDLSGFRISRNLAYNTYYSRGYVIYINGGLEIIDSSENHGGTITGGSSTTAGGVYVTGANANLKINGGAITGNRGAYGVYVASTAQIGVGGSGRVYNNLTSSNTASNIVLANDNTRINVLSKFEDDAFSGNAKISIAKVTNNAASPNGSQFTLGWSNFYGEDADPSKYFASDASNLYWIVPIDVYNEVTVPAEPPAEVALDDTDGGSGDGTEGSDPGSTTVTVKTVEAAVFCHDNQKNWNDACQRSMSTGEQQTFTLYSDWKADSNSSYTTAFGTTTYYYASGGLYVYSTSNIKLNLNGYSLNRNLSAARNHGFVLRVNGKLEVVNEIDPKTGNANGNGGLITGGFNNYAEYAGGIAVYSSGQLTLKGGTITGNRGTYRGGVSVYSSAVLNLGENVRIYGNTTTAGAASNIYMTSATGCVNVIAPLTGLADGERYGISRAGNGVFTSGFGTHMGVDAKPDDYFESENGLYYVLESDGTDDAGNRTREGAMLSSDNGINWLYTVQQSLANQGEEKTFVLRNLWEAAANSTYGRAFGTNGTAYYNGGLYVPAGASVVLDLNGNSINRLNTSKIVIYVAGTLRIIDSKNSAASEIKGGSQGVYVYNGGTCIMQGGTVTGNAAYGVQINKGVFEMTGGSVTKNNGAYNVYATANGVLRLGGNPVISDPTNQNSKNVYLAPSNVIEIVSKFDDGVVIPVERLGIGPLTSGWEEHNKTADGGQAPDATLYFRSENVDYTIKQDDYTTLKTNEDGTAVQVTQKEAFIVSYNNIINWHYAVTTSLSTGTTQSLRLYPTNYNPDTDSGLSEADNQWKASSNSSYTTAFGTLSSFINGALYV
ncbi:MAG: hypothetical protein K2H43_04430, partial [Clostridia bacterium]|nr:hypothetical protein [Clostridia bacterium]